MKRHLTVALLVWLAVLIQLGRSDVQDENDTGEGELSKRAIETAQRTFRKLKSSFIKLAAKGKATRVAGRPGTRITFNENHLEKITRITGYLQFGLKNFVDGHILYSGKQDIVFVMDKSGSIGSSNFVLEKRFVENLVEYFPIFPTKTRVAIVTYSTTVKLEFNFNKYINKECLRKGIQGIRYTGGTTATGSALQFVKNSLLFNSAAGARSDATKVIYVLTDGKSNVGVKPGIPAGQLKQRRVVIFAMGVTSNIRESELLEIATSKDHVFHVKDYAALDEVTKLLQGDLSQKCRNGQIVFDACGRRCKCRAGKLVQCCRLRKEFTDMTFQERVRYINTVKTASSVLPFKTSYETLLTLHRMQFFTPIHRRDFFLPWHRWFIIEYENLLRQIDCRVTVPYWDWSLVGASPFTSNFWNTGASGFGGNGNPPGGCVNTGPFRAGQFSLVASAGGGCLTRNFNGRAPDTVAVAILLTTTPANFFQFEATLRGPFHDNIHCIIDGTMCTIDAASAPEFFLHHGFDDKIWSDWQKKSNAHKFNTFFQNHPSIMTSTPYRPRELLDLSNQPGCICAEYVDPKSSVYRAVKGLSKSQLLNIPRLPLPQTSAKAVQLFKTSPAEVELISRLRKQFEPKRSLRKSDLKGGDAKLGFRLDDVMNARASG